jgi:hypothetical protein
MLQPDQLPPLGDLLEAHLNRRPPRGLMLKLANRRAAFYGDAGRLDEGFDCLDRVA